jgi:hypothetical protein
MTYDKNTENSESSGHSYGPRGPSWGGSDPFGWAKQPGFHPLKAVAVVAGFAVFPPLGVLALGYFLWNSRRGWQQGGPAMAGGPGAWRGRCGGRGPRGPFTGNQAFDEHQMEEINKLREERRAFHEHRFEQRRKRDAETYEAFRAAQAAKPAGGDDTTKI